MKKKLKKPKREMMRRIDFDNGKEGKKENKKYIIKRILKR